MSPQTLPCLLMEINAHWAQLEHVSKRKTIKRERIVMSKDNPFHPALPTVMSEIAGFGKKNVETFGAVQKEFLDAWNKANRDWIARLNEEATLTSDLTKKMMTAGSIPEAAAIYQTWVSQHMELFSKQAKQFLEDGQNFTKACTKFMGNGPAGS
jgi:hypothetical protein